MRTTLVDAYVRLTDPRLTGAISEMTRSQWLDAEATSARQLARLRTLVAHCEAHVPYYRDLFRRIGFRAADLGSLEDFARLPPLTKEVLQGQRERLVAETVERSRLLTNHSGGSTGAMTTFCLDREALDRARAGQWRFYSWAGLTLGDPHVFVWGAPSDLKMARRLRARLQNLILGRSYFDAFAITDEELARLTRALVRRRPRVITGYASALGRVAEHVEAVGIRIPSLVGIVSTAEVLTPTLRERIEQVFGVRVYNRYGSGEMKDIAQECGAGDAMHVNADNVLVEVETGEVVATNLANRAMPLLRYRMGDLGELVDRPCPCGRGLPRMRLGHGRVCEAVVARDGTWIHSEYFTHLFYGLDGVRQFQLVQNSLDDVEVLVRGDGDLDTVGLARARAALAAKLPGTTVRYTFTDRIAPSPSGKFLFVRSALTGRGGAGPSA